MRQPRFLHGGLFLFLVAWAGSAGCHQHYYYGAVPQCVPGAPGPVQYGSVCDVPPAGGGTTVVQNGSRSSAVGTGTPPRVVVSQPTSPRLSWRRSDPEASVATTRVEGAIDSSTTTK